MYVYMYVSLQAVDLEKSMAELSYLGALLGMPNILDPEFPLAYSAFFGSFPVTSEQEEAAMALGGGTIKMETGESKLALNPTSVHASNVSVVSRHVVHVHVHACVCTCTCESHVCLSMYS